MVVGKILAAGDGTGTEWGQEDCIDQEVGTVKPGKRACLPNQGSACVVEGLQTVERNTEFCPCPFPVSSGE